LDYREEEYDVKDAALDQKMHKAIAMIQFKLEGQLIHRRPEFQMEHRLLLDKMDLEKGTVEVLEPSLEDLEPKLD
jgi:fructose-1,6-bisphosphatase-3